MSPGLLLAKSLLKNSPSAQLRIAAAYQHGKGVSRDESEAARWYRKAADQGHAEAQYQLALMYDQGEGVAQDAAEAQRWYRAAADQGHALAQYCVTEPAGDSNRQARTDENSIAALQAAAADGDAEAAWALALMYQHGRGVEKDLAQMQQWLEQAAGAGHAKAQYQLGVQLHGEQDFVAALKWLSAAASQDHARAQFNLAMMYFRGEGVGEDPVTAWIWFSEAARGQLAQAEKGRDLCWQKMNEQQRSEAQMMLGGSL